LTAFTTEQYITKYNIQYQWLTECSIHQTALSVYKSKKYTNAIKSLSLLLASAYYVSSRMCFLSHNQHCQSTEG